MSYLRNYIIIALCLYGVSVIKYFFQINLSWTPWYILKTTNLFIIYHMERLYAHTKRMLYGAPVISTDTRHIEDIRKNMSVYGLRRDKVYCMLVGAFYSIRNVFGISRYNKRNYLTFILTILFTKRSLLMRLMIKAYRERGHYKIMTFLYKVNNYIKRIDPNKIKKLGLCTIAVIIVLVIVKIAPKLWKKYIKKSKAENKEEMEKAQINTLETLNILQNKLGDYIILIVNKVRAIDKLLVEKQFAGYKELVAQVLEEVKNYGPVLEEMKHTVSEIEQVKDIEVYGMDHVKYGLYLLSLMDLNKELDNEEVLSTYEEYSTLEDRAYDEESVDEARGILYDHLKKCIEYYDELDVYLAKASTGKRRGKKKIYQREQMASMQGASAVIESYFE